MGPKLVTWQDKARTLLERRRMSARRLATMMGEKEKNVRNWLGGSHRPVEELAVVKRIAIALEVSHDWLLDGEAGEPPRAASVSIPDEVLRRVPARFRRLAYALTDEQTAEHLLSCLDLYERAQRRGRTGT